MFFMGVNLELQDTVSMKTPQLDMLTENERQKGKKWLRAFSAIRTQYSMKQMGLTFR